MDLARFWRGTGEYSELAGGLLMAERAKRADTNAHVLINKLVKKHSAN